MRVLMTLAAVLLLAPVAGPDSLGDAARRQAQLREKTPKAEAKVYGDADLAAGAPDFSAGKDEPAGERLADSRATASASGGVASEPDPPARAVEPEPSRGSGQDQTRRELEREERARRQKESYWRQSAQNARTRLAAAQRNYDFVCAGGVLLTGG